MAFLHLLFGIFGNVTALLLFISPMITFKRIINKGSTEEFSGIPYTMAWMNCILYAWYGLPFISENNLLVSTINGAGAALETIYIFIFLIYAPKNKRNKILVIFVFGITAFSGVALVSFFALHGNIRKHFCGIIAAIFSVMMYGSPLFIMKLVIQTKSVEFLPFFPSLFVFLCSSSWLVYGLFGHDLFVTIPNPLGCLLGALQLILYFMYRNQKNNKRLEEAAPPPADQV